MYKFLLILCFGLYYQVSFAGGALEIQAGKVYGLHPVKSDSNFKQRPELRKGIFLIAGNNLKDPNFNQTVILITAFDMTGTTGLIINRTTEVLIDQVLPQFSAFGPLAEYLNIGGPVATNTFSLLVRTDLELDSADAAHIFDNVYLINTLDTLQAIASDNVNETFFRLFAGYSGWAPGQLESELLRGDWHIWHAEAEMIFDSASSDIWQNLIELVNAKWVNISY